MDECTCWCYRAMYDEHSTYSSTDFLHKLIQLAPFPIKRVQTDNGTEFANALVSRHPAHQYSLFEQALQEMGIEYQRIRVASRRHNGKVERQRRLDIVRFYSKLRRYSLDDGRKQMEAYNKLSNEIPKICLAFKSPSEVLDWYLGVM